MSALADAAVASGAKPRSFDSRDARQRVRRAFSPKELAYFEEMVDYYAKTRVGLVCVKDSTVVREIPVLWDLVAYCGAPPWRLSGIDFARWGKHLFDDYDHSQSRQKASKRVVRDFLSIVMSEKKFATCIPMEFGGCRVEQLVHPWNSPTFGKSVPPKPQPCLSTDEIAILFKSLEEDLEIARKTRSKDIYPLSRDIAWFYATYALGLRASESVGLNYDGWRWNECRPEFGNLGYTHVTGKFGKTRPVMATNPELVATLEWYLVNIRDHFLPNSKPGERAMFLTERGGRVTYSLMAKRFKRALFRAGLVGKGYHLHSLRHSSVTHEQFRFTAEFVQKKSGHSWLGTTMLYSKFSDENLQREFLRVTGVELDRAQGKEKSA